MQVTIVDSECVSNSTEYLLFSITKDSDEMTNFISVFIEEHGEPPAFNIFESCEEVSKR